MMLPRAIHLTVLACLSTTLAGAAVAQEWAAGTIAGTLGGKPVSWAIEDEWSDYHFESENVGSLRLYAEPVDVLDGIGALSMMIMIDGREAKLLDIRIEDRNENPILTALPENARLTFLHQMNAAGEFRFTGTLRAGPAPDSDSGVVMAEQQLTVEFRGRIGPSGH